VHDLLNVLSYIYSMASTYCASEVVNLMSDWEESENEHECEDFEDSVTSEFQVDPIDIAQCVTCPTSPDVNLIFTRRRF